MSSQMTAVELLEIGDGDRKKPWLNQYWPHFLGVTFGITTGVMLNFATRRPIFSGVQKHVAGVAGWVALLSIVQNKRNSYYAEKDAVMRHYIELHPHDFQPTERKRYGEILEPWVPVR